jgi:hypothetical protein
VAFITQKLKPFTVPNFVVVEGVPSQRQDGVDFKEGIPIRYVPRETLEKMCEEFKAVLLQKAGYETIDNQG